MPWAMTFDKPDSSIAWTVAFTIAEGMFDCCLSVLELCRCLKFVIRSGNLC